MSPITGVEFLTMQQQMSARRSGIELQRKVRNVGNALLLVYDKVFDDRQIFRGRLLDQVLWSITIGAAIVHVYVHITADQSGCSVDRNEKRPHPHRKFGGFPSAHIHLAPLKTIFKSAHDINTDFARRNRDCRLARRIEVVGLKPTLGPVKAVIGVHPRVVGRVRASVRSSHENPCCHRLSQWVDDAQRNPPHRLQVFPLARHDFMALVMAAVAASGFSVIFSSHVVSELERFADYLIVLANGRVQMVGDIDDLLTSHKVLSGPAEESDLVGEQFTVVQTRKATRHAELLVRTTGESQLPSGWESDDVSLEELVLAYLRDPSASMLPGPLAPDELEVSEAAR